MGNVFLFCHDQLSYLNGSCFLYSDPTYYENMCFVMPPLPRKPNGDLYIQVFVEEGRRKVSLWPWICIPNSSSEPDRISKMGSEEPAVVGELLQLHNKLGKKQSFEDAVARISSIVCHRYSPSASQDLRKAIYSAVCRVATILQTRHTVLGFWLAGLKLFEETERRVTESSERGHLKKCIARAREHLHETENPPQILNTTNNNRRYLFEGHLTVEPEPPPPTWLVAQNLLTTLAASQDLNAVGESSRGQGTEDNNTNESNRVPDFVQEMINNVQEFDGLQDISDVIEASLREIGAGPQRPPPASKEVVANLPIINVTDEIIARLGSETECAVCRENLVLNDEMQELPCEHLFHPYCLKPWLDENNSCPICRHELRTDDHAYESQKERDKEEEEERKGAANALPGGEFMYV